MQSVGRGATSTAQLRRHVDPYPICASSPECCPPAPLQILGWPQFQRCCAESSDNTSHHHFHPRTVRKADIACKPRGSQLCHAQGAAIVPSGSRFCKMPCMRSNVGSASCAGCPALAVRTPLQHGTQGHTVISAPMLLLRLLRPPLCSCRCCVCHAAASAARLAPSSFRAASRPLLLQHPCSFLSQLPAGKGSAFDRLSAIAAASAPAAI
jgi:hypothetical protein